VIVPGSALVEEAWPRAPRGLKRVPATGLASARSSDPGIGVFKNIHARGKNNKQTRFFWPWCVFSCLARARGWRQRSACSTCLGSAFLGGAELEGGQTNTDLFCPVFTAKETEERAAADRDGGVTNDGRMAQLRGARCHGW
jgi:hypothetical protein